MMSINNRGSLIKNIRDSIKDNKRCINCNDDIPQYVCTTFGTFVCLRCALLHREFKHKIKNVVLSSFSDEELNYIKATGNNVANSIWFAKWNKEESRPNSEDELRNFIKEVWVDEKWKKDEEVQQKVVQLTQSISTNNPFSSDNLNQTFEPFINDSKLKNTNDGVSHESKFSIMNENINHTSDDLLLDISPSLSEHKTYALNNHTNENHNLNSTLSKETHVINTTLVQNRINTSNDNTRNLDILTENLNVNFEFSNQQTVHQKSYLDFEENNSTKDVNLFGFSSSSELDLFKLNTESQKVNQVNFDNSTESMQKSNSDMRYSKGYMNNNSSVNLSYSYPELNYKPKPYVPPSYKQSSEPRYESNEYMSKPSQSRISNSSYFDITPIDPLYTPQESFSLSNLNNSGKQLYNFESNISQSHNEDYLLAMKLQREEEEEARKREYYNSQLLKNDELLAKSLLNSIPK